MPTSHIYLRKDTRSLELVEHVTNSRTWVSIFNNYFIEFYITKKKPHAPIFLFTKNTGAPHGETLSLIILSFNKSCSWIFNSFIFVRAILYGALDIGVVYGNKSMANSTPLSGGGPG